MKSLPKFILFAVVAALLFAARAPAQATEVVLGEFVEIVPANETRFVELPTYSGLGEITGGRIEWTIDDWSRYGLESRLSWGQPYDPSTILISRDEYAVTCSKSVRLFSGRDYVTGYGLLYGNVDRDLTAFDGVIDFDRPRPYAGSGFTVTYGGSRTRSSNLTERQAKRLANRPVGWQVPPFLLATEPEHRIAVSAPHSWTMDYSVQGWSPGHGYVLQIESGRLRVHARVILQVE